MFGFGFWASGLSGLSGLGKKICFTQKGLKSIRKLLTKMTIIRNYDADKQVHSHILSLSYSLVPNTRGAPNKSMVA